MKKLIAILLILAMLSLGLCACGGNNNDDDTTTTVPNENPPVEDEGPEEEGTTIPPWFEYPDSTPIELPGVPVTPSIG